MIYKRFAENGPCTAVVSPVVLTLTPCISDTDIATAATATDTDADIDTDTDNDVLILVYWY